MLIYRKNPYFYHLHSEINIEASPEALTKYDEGLGTKVSIALKFLHQTTTLIHLQEKIRKCYYSISE